MNRIQCIATVTAAMAVAVASLIAESAAAAAVPAGGCFGGDRFGSISSGSTQDVDGDGCPDLVVGVPGATIAGAPAAGAVDVRFAVGADSPPSAQRIDLAYFGQPVAAGDRFGGAVAVTDLDGEERFQDAVVGAPGTDVGRGSVVLAYGSADGLTTSGAVVVRGTQAGEHFGTGVVADGPDVWITAPDRTVDGRAGAGAVDHYRVVDGRAVLVQTLQQGTAPIGGTAEAGDHFGATVALSGSALVIGVPDEAIGSIRHAGIVTAVRTSSTTHLVTAVQSINQNTAGIGGTAEANDRFGASVSLHSTTAAIGVPGEAIGSLAAAGLVQLVDFRFGKAAHERVTLTQSSPTISGTVESGDQFGASVLLGSFTGWTTNDIESGNATGDYELAIGSPGEDLGTVRDAGTVTVVLLDLQDNGSYRYVQKIQTVRRGGTGDVYWTLSGTPTAGDRVGATLSSLRLPDERIEDGFDTFYRGGAQLVVATPGDDTGATDAGSLTVLRRTHLGSTATGVRLQDSAGAAAGERYGVGGDMVATSAQETGNSG